MALFDDKDEDLIKSYLFNKIEKECDADPEIMTDYILVTLRNEMDKDELKQHCKTDLREFFGDQTDPFVDSLFTALEYKSYLPNQPKAQAVNDPVKAVEQAAAAATRDKSYENGNTSASPPRRDRTSSRRRSRSPDHHRSSPRDRHERSSRSPSRERHLIRSGAEINSALLDGPLEPANGSIGIRIQGMNNAAAQQIHGQHQKRSRPCFEFIRKGKCQRGNNCNFEHITLEQAQARGITLPPNLINAVHQRQQQQQQQQMIGGPQGQFMIAPNSMQQQQMMAQGMQMQQGAGGFYGMQMRPQQQGMQQSKKFANQAQQPQPQQQQQQQQQQPGNWNQNTTSGNGSGQPEATSQTGIFVTNIPDEALNETSIFEFFKQFGDITEKPRIDFNKHTAIIEFSTPHSQQLALSTPKAIFNNRFVRVLRARLPNGASATGDHAKQNEPPVWRPKSAAIKKAEMIEKYLDQQKQLMAKLTSQKEIPAAMRKIIMNSINEIQAKIDAIRNPAAAAAKKAATRQAATHAPAGDDGNAATSTTASNNNSSSSNDASAAAAASAAVDEGSNGQQKGGVQSEKEALQAKLEALKQEAERLGMSTRAIGGFKGASSRGRGGGWAGPGRGSMSLDKRPRTLVLGNVGQEAAERLDSELAQFGEIEQVLKSEERDEPPFAYSVKFKARWEAENAMKAINTIEAFGDVKVEWGA